MAAVSKNTKRTMKTIGGVIQIMLNVLFYVLVIIAIMRFSIAAYELSYQVFGNVTVQMSPGTDKTVTIGEGDSSMEIASMLEEQGLIVNKYSFLVRERLTVSDRHPIVPGSYTLNTSMPYETIIEIITGMGVEEDGAEE